jgi:hypothetical protein
MTPSDYIADVKAALIASPLVATFEIIEAWSQPDRGYIRSRIRLTNGDFVEVSEYFIVIQQVCLTERYRYQWMDGQQKQLYKRWDNVEHYPNLPNFPHHIHCQNGQVKPGKSLNIIDLLNSLDEEIT